MGDEHIGQNIDLLAASGRDGDDIGPFAELIDSQQLSRQGLLGHGIGLGHHSDDGRARFGQVTGDEAVARADLLVGRDAEGDDIDTCQGLAHQVVETFTEKSPGTVKAGGVDQDQLGIAAVNDTAHIVAGRLRPARGDGDLGTDQGVGQRRLPGIGASHQAGEARPKILGRLGNDDLDARRGG